MWNVESITRIAIVIVMLPIVIKSFYVDKLEHVVYSSMAVSLTSIQRVTFSPDQKSNKNIFDFNLIRDLKSFKTAIWCRSVFSSILGGPNERRHTLLHIHIEFQNFSIYCLQWFFDVENYIYVQGSWRKGELLGQFYSDAAIRGREKSNSFNSRMDWVWDK